ncbi:MAG: hypothetical protein ICV60_21430 [Pyrinomonadaceae bacterium]|nr:hypothetical protein [Pyrinomonadaceae bacterium]
MDKQVALALDQIIGKIEPLTRFDRDSLKQESDCVRVTAGKAYWRFDPNIFIKNEEQTGRLPGYIEQTDNLEQLNAVAQQTLSSAWDALPNRLQSWLQSNARTDRKLEPDSCFTGPQTFGYERECKTCGARGWVICPNCPKEHKGYVACPKCPDKHKGRIDCSKCKNIWGTSKGYVDCKGCGGSGKKDGQTCKTCGGQKRFVCSTCGGDKTVVCDKCHGAGNIPCPTCETTGRVPCTDCASTGWLHSLRIVDCTVSDSFNVVVNDVKSEVTRQLMNRDLEGLRELADVTQLPPTVQNNVVKREYNVECIITEIRLKVAEQNRELVGFGPKAHIFDYKAIVSDLLQSDLETLQQEVSNTPRRLWGLPRTLLDATRLFLASEVNVQIDDPRWTRENIVTRDYVEQAKSSVRSGLEKLFLTRIGLAVLISVLLPIAVFMVSHFTGLREMIGLWVFLASLTVAAASWILLERNARQRLMNVFDDSLDERIDGLLQKYKILWKLRGLSLALIIILLILAAALLP